MQQLGMIAGAGELPAIIARQTYQDGQPLPTVALSADVAAKLAPYCPSMAQFGPGQLSKIIRTLRRHAVHQVVIVGKVPKRWLFESPRFDLRAIRLLSKLQDYQDITLLQAIVDEFGREGLEVVEQSRLLGHLLTPSGVLGAQQPGTEQWGDIRYGFAVARQLASMDIGQTIVVRRRTVLAVEAVEGTDAAIRRGCELGQHGAVVVKVSRPQQDMRFDVPTVGPHTLQELITGGSNVLAIEAGTTFVIHLPELVHTANAHRIALVGVSQDLLQRMGAEGGA